MKTVLLNAKGQSVEMVSLRHMPMKNVITEQLVQMEIGVTQIKTVEMGPHVQFDVMVRAPLLVQSLNV
tara:strand:- start:10758 stop:10961 length:204 start_codon:yes stop_codon:yes gene_type:complete